MKTSLFNYRLPKKFIAQKPVTPRDHSRLLVFDRDKNKITHDFFYNLPKYLKAGDVLVFNNSKVIPARLIMQKPTGGRTEIFLLRDLGKGKWECLIKGGIKKTHVGTGHCPVLYYKIQRYTRTQQCHIPTLDNFKCKILNKLPTGNWLVKFNLSGKRFQQALNKYGETPTPPYIKTKDSEFIKKRYQTIYAQKQGSVAAPTAGLHFTKSLFNRLNTKFVQQEYITLHVGLGTFAPVKTENIKDHEMHEEFTVIDKATCSRLEQAKKDKKRIIAVGTTSLRALEAASFNSHLKPIESWVKPFIFPGYEFKFTDKLITNFHLPNSTLLMLVAALMPQKKNKDKISKIMDIYKLAIKKNYRFYSFGDAMLII